MRFRGTFILLGVFVVLGGYVYFAEYRNSDEREQQEASKKKLFSTPLKEVTELSLVYPDHRISAVKKDDKRWEITEPQGIDSDSEQWEMLASSLSQIEKDGIVSGSSDPAQYGLDKPAVEVRVKTKDGHSVGILFGAENPKKSHNYAKLADTSEIFLSPVTWSKTFQKSLADMRNKKVLDFTVEDINSIRIEDGKNHIELQKSGMDWLLTKDIKADTGEVSGFLSALQSARAMNFAADGTSPASEGLTPPESRITLHDAKANADRVLSIGKSAETDKYYAKDESRPAIMIIEKEIPAKVRRPVVEWRDRTIVHLEPESIDEIEIVRGKEKIAVKKQGTDWKLADGRKAQSEKISNLLVTLEFERAIQIIDTGGSSSNGLDKPRLEATLRTSGKDVVGLKFGGATRNPDGSYLKVSTSPSVMTVAADFYEKFNLKADDLAETQPAPK